jgi:hypothetical protein
MSDAKQNGRLDTASSGPAARICAGKPGRESYTEADRRVGLGALALCSGNGRKAAALLERAGQRIPSRTLYAWRHDHADLYREIREGAVAKVKADAAEVYTDIAGALIEDAGALRQRLSENVEDIPARDVPGAIRNVMTGAAIATDKASTLRDEPTSIVQHRSSAEILRALASKGVLEADAEDVTDADVVPHPALPATTGQAS